MTPETFTGWPESLVGENLALRAACTAASRSIGRPLVAFAATTLPLSSRTTSTMTVPCVRIRLAVSGWVVGDSPIAVPLRTPPEIGLSIGRGPGAGGGSSMTTRGTWVSGLTTGVLRSTGPETILTAFADADGNCGATVTGVVFPLSRLLVGAGFGSVTGLLSGAADAGC